MLEYLRLRNVGPAPEMELRLAKRLNIITGDNGLGKTFLLDAAWWALTRKWPRELNPRLTFGYKALPTDPKRTATIEFQLTSKVKSVAYKSTWKPRDEAWVGNAGRPWNPGLVIYAHADGGFSVWDPARNYWKKKGNIDIQERLPGFVFSNEEVWQGLYANIDGKPTKVCNGLLHDWSVWIKENGSSSQIMEAILQDLLPEGEFLGIGPLARLSVNESQDIPTIRTGYRQSVPIVHASSGVRRIAGLAYMTMWSWNEHQIAAERLGENPTPQVIFLFDELESHLHPRWQRLILRALLDVTKTLHPQAKVQLIVATHSPLVLASAEPWFDSDTDSWFDLDCQDDKVALTKRDYIRRGEVSNWLTSEAFDLKSARSVEAENAIERALFLLRDSGSSRESIKEADAALRAAGLPDIDPFWIRWGKFVEDSTVGSRRKR